MIKIFATGNLGKDAETRQINSEHSVTSFSIASTKKIKGENVTTWINCNKWNAGALANYLTKGTKVAIMGELEIREHDGKYYTSITVFELEFLSSKKDEQKEETGVVYQGSFPDSGMSAKEYAKSKEEPLDDDEDNGLPF